MTATDNKSYLGFLIKLVDQWNNTYHPSIGKKAVDADYSILTNEIESIHKAPKFKPGDRIRITNCNNIFSREYTKNWSKEIDSVLKTDLWTCKIKYLNGGE